MPDKSLEETLAQEAADDWLAHGKVRDALAEAILLVQKRRDERALRKVEERRKELKLTRGVLSSPSIRGTELEKRMEECDEIKRRLEADDA